MECSRSENVLHCMSMDHLCQADSLQGFCGASCGVLAVDNLGTSTGWSSEQAKLSAICGGETVNQNMLQRPLLSARCTTPPIMTFVRFHELCICVLYSFLAHFFP